MVAILAAFEASLTLPGIAGLVLTVGMAVDANIIIYERIREELRARQVGRARAVDAGFKRAFWTVFDAHVTNFVAGVVLYSYGSGPIRGFAVTLLVGIVTNLFTSYWLSHWMFDALVGRRGAARAPCRSRGQPWRRRTNSRSSSRSSSRARTSSSSAMQTLLDRRCRSSWSR